MGLSKSDEVKIARSMEKIEKGQAITNIKEFKKAELFKVRQFWERNRN
jgi:DNA sulfur modification protein DndE